MTVDLGHPPEHHEPAPQELPVASPETDDDVLRGIAKALEYEALMRTAANKAANALKAAAKATRAAYEHAAAYYASTRQVEMKFTTGGTEPENPE
jgi:hypothetical protein